jgi:asparagine synthase (glutamine-hydrolysing)
MGASIEARVPFLDHKVVELAMSIPEALKIKGGTLKYILKKAVRGLVPDDIIDRKKQGFAVPMREWLAGSLGKLARRELRNFCADTTFLYWPEVERMLTKGDIRRVWFLLNFALMWKHCIAGYRESLTGQDEPLVGGRYNSVASYASFRS